MEKRTVERVPVVERFSLRGSRELFQNKVATAKNASRQTLIQTLVTQEALTHTLNQTPQLSNIVIVFDVVVVVLVDVAVVCLFVLYFC